MLILLKIKANELKTLITFCKYTTYCYPVNLINYKM